MDEDIHRQVISLSDLRSQRNFVLPVFRLLPETLEIIFIHGARDYHESDSGGHSTTCISTCVNVSYVCSHWRNIALNCPSLWTYPFHLSLRWTEELLLGSKQAPSKISWISNPISPPGAEDPRAILLYKLLEHIERVQTLCLSVFWFPAELSLCTPNLERSKIRSWPYIIRPSMMITDGKPRLCTLKLINCSLP